MLKQVMITISMVFLGLAIGILLVGCAKPAEKPLCMSGDVQVDTACVPPPEITKGKQ